MKELMSKSLVQLLYQAAEDQFLPISDVGANLLQHTAFDREVIQRNARRFIRLTTSNNQLQISFDLEILQNIHSRVLEERSERELISEFLRKGASKTCMHFLFGLKKHEVQRLRKYLPAEIIAVHAARGRPNTDRMDDIVYAWKTISSDDSLPLPERILAVHDAVPETTIAEIWNVIHTHLSEETAEASDSSAERATV